jgi:hypothetical protein
MHNVNQGSLTITSVVFKIPISKLEFKFGFDCLKCQFRLVDCLNKIEFTTDTFHFYIIRVVMSELKYILQKGIKQGKYASYTSAVCIYVHDTLQH